MLTAGSIHQPDEMLMEDSSFADDFRIGAWQVQPSLNRVTLDGHVRQVEPRVMAVLVVLARQAGRVVSREELLEEVWAGVVVNEDALTRCISELRKILDADSRSPSCVETIRGKGYRLIAPVHFGSQFVDQTLVSSSSLAAPSPVPGERLTFRLLAYGLVGVFLVAAVVHLAGSAPDALRPDLLVAVPFSSYEGQEIHPALSPDGSRVAFAWDNAGEFDIYVKQQNSEVPLRLSDHPARELNPVWSPDGTSVAFVRDEDGENSIHVVPSMGGPSRRVVTGGAWIQSLDWSPGGLAIAFSARQAPGDPLRLVELDLESGQQRPLVEIAPSSAHDMSPRYSPSGTALAFIRRGRTGGQDLFLLNLVSHQVRALTRNQLGLQGLDWVSDDEIIFSAFRSGTYALWKLDVGSGDVSWVPARAERTYNPSASTQSGKVVFQELWYEKNVWRIGLDGMGWSAASSEPIITSTRWDCEAFYSPDGEQLVFTSARSGQLELWLSAGDGSNPYQLTDFDGAFVGNPRWSPDGERVAFYASPAGQATVYVIEADGGGAIALTEPSWNALVTGWSSDGEWIYFTSEKSGSWELWQVTADGSRTRQVTRNGAFSGAESTDGRSLYFTRANQDGLFRVGLVDGLAVSETEVVLPNFPASEWGNWILLDGGIYFVDRSDEGPVVRWHDFASGTTRFVADVANIASPSLSASWDGLSLLYGRIERSESDLMMMTRAGR